jgi:uncharacterized membrane protein YcaP (DUF421 family)
MRSFRIFLLRLLISIIIASAISVFFFKGIQLFKTSLLILVMLALAYLFEYSKKKDKKGDNP